MNFFKNLSIRHKLEFITLLVCAAAILTGFILVILIDLASFKDDLKQRTTMLAILTGENCVVGLEFDQEADVIKTLKGLEDMPSFMCAVLYKKDGGIFASYPAEAEAPPRPRIDQSITFSDEYSSSGYLELFRTVYYRNAPYGTIYLRMSTKELYLKAKQYLGTMALILLGTLLLSWALIHQLHPLISGPILNLAKVTQKITEESDYGIRVKKTNNDEIGSLYDGFNEMLSRIQQDKAKLDKFNEELEQTVKERTRQLRGSLKKLEVTNYRLEDANRHRTRFLSAMSHELRTPLNAILGFSDLVIRKYFGPLNEKQESYMRQIETSGKHLLALINDLLDVAKIDAGAMSLTLEPLDVAECFEGAVNMVRTQSNKKSITVETIIPNELPPFYADGRKVRQIMLNLLSNAVKYTPENGRITITAEIDQPWIKTTVTDTGIGIEEEDADKIFSEFYQANRKRDEALGGTGIGLALTRRLVEMHGGEIGLVSEVGKGSSFWFNLPVKKETSREPEKAVHLDHKSRRFTKGLRILVVEDNEVNRAMIIDMLQVQDHQIIVAKNGKEGVDLAGKHHPDMILMDIRMPVMDGLEATRQIRGKNGFETIPIIALTASAEPEAKKMCVSAGCSAHLPKPIQSHELYEAIEEMLSLAKTNT